MISRVNVCGLMFPKMGWEISNESSALAYLLLRIMCFLCEHTVIIRFLLNCHNLLVKLNDCTFHIMISDSLKIKNLLLVIRVDSEPKQRPVWISKQSYIWGVVLLKKNNQEWTFIPPTPQQFTMTAIYFLSI